MMIWSPGFHFAGLKDCRDNLLKLSHWGAGHHTLLFRKLIPVFFSFHFPSIGFKALIRNAGVKPNIIKTSKHEARFILKFIVNI